MEAWPGVLPQSVLTDYEMVPRDGLLDVQEERNPTRNRTYPEWDATFSMILSSSQLVVLRSFYDDTIKQSGEFTIPWLAGLGFEFHFARFGPQGPSWRTSQILDHWVVTLPLEIIAGVELDSFGDPEIFPPEEVSSDSGS